MRTVSVEVGLAKLDDHTCLVRCKHGHVLRRLQGYFEILDAVESYSPIKGGQVVSDTGSLGEVVGQIVFRVADAGNLDDVISHLKSDMLPLFAAEAVVIPPWPVRHMGLILAILSSLVFTLATIDCLGRGESPWPTYLWGWAIVGLNLLSQHLGNLSLQSSLDEVHAQWLDSYR